MNKTGFMKVSSIHLFYVRSPNSHLTSTQYPVDSNIKLVLKASRLGELLCFNWCTGVTSSQLQKTESKRGQSLLHYSVFHAFHKYRALSMCQALRCSVLFNTYSKAMEQVFAFIIDELLKSREIKSHGPRPAERKRGRKESGAPNPACELRMQQCHLEICLERVQR